MSKGNASGDSVERKQDGRKPWERTSALVTGLGGVIAIALAVTQQRPASVIAAAAVFLLLAVWFVVRVFTAKFKSGRRRFPRGRWLALAGVAVLVAGIGVAFTLSGPREFLLAKVVGVPTVSQDVKVAQIRVLQSQTDYELAITILNTMPREQLVKHFKLSPVCSTAAPHTPVDRYQIKQRFEVRGLSSDGTLIAGSALEPGDDEFFADVTGVIDRDCDGPRLDMGLNARLPPNQHADLTIVIPKVIVVQDDAPRPTQPGQPSAAVQQRTRSVPVPKPDSQTRVELTVGDAVVVGQLNR